MTLWKLFPQCVTGILNVFEYIAVAYAGSSTGRKNGSAQIFSQQISRRIVTKLRSKYGAKMVNAKFASLFTTPYCGMQMWYLPSLPHIYLSLFSFFCDSKVPCLRKHLDGQGLKPGPPDQEFKVLIPWSLTTPCG